MDFVPLPNHETRRGVNFDNGPGVKCMKKMYVNKKLVMVSYQM